MREGTARSGDVGGDAPGGGDDCYVHIARSCSDEEMVRFRQPPDEGYFGRVRVNCFFSNTKVTATGWWSPLRRSSRRGRS